MRSVPAAIGAFLAVALTASACSYSFAPEAETVPLPAAQPVPAGVTDPATDPALSRFYGQKLSWGECPELEDSDARCTWLTVPVDWAAPQGETLKLWVGRIPALDEGKRLGALMYNPGGPGVPAVEYLDSASYLWRKPVRSAYDQVLFDPRGVGKSAPVKCLSDKEFDTYIAADATPDNPAEVSEAVASTTAFGAACLKNSGPVIRHMDTVSVVRDMDVLRHTLGQQVLSYMGTSYGTFLGSWYAQLFPWRTGRLVLDAAVDPSLSSQEYARGQAQGFSRALRAFVTDCLRHDECPLRGSVDQGVAQIGAMVDASDVAPMKTSTRPLTQSLMTLGIGQALYSEQLWEMLRTALREAVRGDGTGLLELADQYIERDADGHYGQTMAANPAMYCLDFPETRTVAQIGADAARLKTEFPPLGDAIGWGSLGCDTWPLKAVLTPQKLTAQGAAPILVVGTVDDPATPYEWAQGLASQLSSGVLLTWEGHQHSAYNQGSDCIDAAVEGYLLSGKVPAADTRCPA